MTLALHAAGLVSAPVLLAVALSATGLGLVVPLLRDARLLTTPVGQTVAAAASVAEFSAVVVLALGFSSGHTPLLNVTLLGALVVLTIVVTVAGRRLGARGAVTALLDRLSDGTTQLRVRLSVALVVGFAALAQRLGLEVVLGAFFAGGILNVLDHGMRDRDFRGRLDGDRLRVPGAGLLHRERREARPVSAELVAGRPGRRTAARAHFAGRSRAAHPAAAARTRVETTVGAGLLFATSLPFIVTAAQVGLDDGRLDAATAAAMTTAGLIGVCLFPVLGVTSSTAHSTPSARGTAGRHSATDQFVNLRHQRGAVGCR